MASVVSSGENSEKVQVRILFFAKARELAETSESDLFLVKQTSKPLLIQAIEEQFPALKTLNRSFVLALNEEYLEDSPNSIELSPRDELAVIPPISGG